jgi:Protein of unknown function (DUF5132)
MAVLDDVLNGRNVTTGLLVGVGALIAWPLISPIARPLAKSLIKAGMMAYSQAEQLCASAVEGFGDLVAEVQEEIGSTTPSQTNAEARNSAGP